MNLNFSEDQLALQDSLRRFVAKEYPFAKRRQIAKDQAASSAPATGYCAQAWKQLADLGVLALPFDEQFGGLGGNAVDVMVVMEELGRGLMQEPYLATVVLCGGLIGELGTTAQKEALLPAIGSGDLLLALAHQETDGRYASDQVRAEAKQVADKWLLTGRKTMVLQGAQAGQLIVSAREGNGLSLFLVNAMAPGVSITDHQLHDGTRAATVEFAGVSLTDTMRLGKAGAAATAIDRALDLGNAALCAESVGLMSAMNEATTEYLKTRQQFGVPLSSFQALKHRMVDMFIWTETARSITLLASVRAAGGSAEDIHWACAAARVQVGEAAKYVGQQSIQLHGGMGVTDEMAISHFFKRLTCIHLMFGDADHHLGTISDNLLARAGAV